MELRHLYHMLVWSSLSHLFGSCWGISFGETRVNQHPFPDPISPGSAREECLPERALGFVKLDYLEIRALWNFSAWAGKMREFRRSICRKERKLREAPTKLLSAFLKWKSERSSVETKASHR